jgi:WD40 repeat protein
MKLTLLSTLCPESIHRTWFSTPHPTQPLLATASSDKTVRVYNLRTLTQHSTLEGGHQRSVRCIAWKPNLPPNNLSLVTGSFDSTAGIWRRDEARAQAARLETQIGGGGDDDNDDEDEGHDWEFSMVLEGHDSEIKGVAFSPSGQYLATCSRDKSIWIWEEVGAEGEDEWETVAVLQEHDGDVKAVSWCPDQGVLGGECLASSSYDDTVRLWREDEEGEWGCVAVLEGHEGTVWGIDWEGLPKSGGETEEPTDPARSRRLITCSADATIRVWRKESPLASSSIGRGNGIPSTMRPAPGGETWICEAVLPKVHTRAIYSVSWSKKTGRVVSTGSDSTIAIYEERPKAAEPSERDASKLSEETENAQQTEWHVVGSHKMGHGPYEINHVTWCPRFDGGRKGDEEMIATTGDDGSVKVWAVEE